MLQLCRRYFFLIGRHYPHMACTYCFYLEKEKLFQRKRATADWFAWEAGA
jgi:hypothetical protein